MDARICDQCETRIDEDHFELSLEPRPGPSLSWGYQQDRHLHRECVRDWGQALLDRMEKDAEAVWQPAPPPARDNTPPPAPPPAKAVVVAPGAPVG